MTDKLNPLPQTDDERAADLARIYGEVPQGVVVHAPAYRNDPLNYQAAGLVAALIDGETFHLPGLHDQKNHGRRTGRKGFEPFTAPEKRTRAAERRARIDPDREASAPDRQGKPMMRWWESHSKVLNGRFQRQLREEHAKVHQQPPPKTAKQEADEREARMRDAEWADREAKMRASTERMIRVLKEEFANDPIGGEENIKALREGSEKRIAAAKEAFYGANPKVLTGSFSDHGFQWFERLNEDTPWDEPIPVKDLTGGSQHKVKNGFAWRHKGVTYLVQVGADDKDPAHARAVAQKLAEMHDTLPEGATKFQKGYMWTSASSPNDAYWQERFKDKRHQAAASAGDGSVSFWQKTPAYLPGPIEEGHIVHEFGHNVDQTSLTGGRISKSEEWAQAQADDYNGNLEAVGARRARVVEFLEDVRPGQHRIKQTEGFGKEAPLGVTSYGQSSMAEDLAESLRLYQQGHIGTGIVKASGLETHVNVWFRDLFPGRAKILDKEFPELARQQKAAIKAERDQMRVREERNRKIDADRVARGLRPSE